MSAAIVEPLYDAEEIRSRIGALGRRLEEELAGEDPVILSLLGGSVVFLADLIRAIRSPVRFEFVLVRTTKGSTQPGVIEIEYPIPVEVAGKSLVVLKDVVTSGVIESYLASQLRQHGAEHVRFAALIDVPGERKTPFELDYAMFVPARRGVFVGYGLKDQGRFGNLPYIGLLPGAP